jgi:hypothetical protein
MEKRIACEWHEDLNGRDLNEVSLAEIKETFIDNFGSFWATKANNNWMEIFIHAKIGDVHIDFMMEPYPGRGYYIAYMEFPPENPDGIWWASLYDETKKEEIESPRTLYEVSEGVILPLDLAWEALKTFLETGKRSDKVPWVLEKDIPEGIRY